MSDSPRRHSAADNSQDNTQDPVPNTIFRSSSKYDIYSNTTKPFGESYRRSLILQHEDQETDRDTDSHIDKDSVDGGMGCSMSHSPVADNKESVGGKFSIKGTNENSLPRSKIPIVKEDKVNANYLGYDIPPKRYSTSDANIIYSEVKKSDTTETPSDIQVEKTEAKTEAREMLMQQIRDTKSNCVDTSSKNTDTKNESVVNTTAEVEKKIQNIVNPGLDCSPVSFVEEQYSYEPDKKEASTKLVVRSRSLLNLTENQNDFKNTLNSTLSRSNKITTKPDGTFLRRGSSESDLIDDDSEDSPPPESVIKNNYVSSLKNAFDAIDQQSKATSGKAEAFDGLRQYFQDNKHGLQELLINNNVVIIEPFRNDAQSMSNDVSDYNHRHVKGYEGSCRITGATIKPHGEQNNHSTSNTLPRRTVKPQHNVSNRHVFYHPIKVNRELVDAELPDPDKVKNAREMFERVFKSKSTSEMCFTKPNHRFNTIGCPRTKVTPEVRVIQEGRHRIERKKYGRFIIDPVGKDELRQRYTIHRRWTDTGSLSSGVSSDLSCDHDLDFIHHEESSTDKDMLDGYSSDDDDYIYPYDQDESHPVSTEVLQKIRACGTTVTYYGGKVIAKSNGPIRSPMTMTIMDEIRQCVGASEGRKKFESESQEPYLGVKFRLVKSNSCGSRLEIAGTEDADYAPKLISSHHESFRGKSIAEEILETKEENEVITEEKEENTQIIPEDEEDKVEADRYVMKQDENSPDHQVMTWAELKLKEARKQWHCAPEAVRTPPHDMEFETFEVLDESKPHKPELNETGRG